MKFFAEDDRLIITFQGWEVLWALRRTLVIPRDCISDIEWSPQYTYPDWLVRVGGTGAPGILYAGNFRSSNNGWYFLFLRQPRGWEWPFRKGITAQNVLVITAHDYRYKQLLFTATPEIGASLTNWYRSTSYPIQPSDAAQE